jgi:cellulose synthase/poly-beta-1,6-N-acetylglucosamine synthase-like glycosyltransferase
MMWQLLFWISAFLLLHTYLIYPLLLLSLRKLGRHNTDIYRNKDEFPSISVLLPVYNAASQIDDKLQSIMNTNYPTDKIEIWVGSDACTDGTNERLQQWENKYTFLNVIYFEQRQGKPAILNRLVKETQSPILIFTDVGYQLTATTLPALVRHFKNTDIHLVGSHVINQPEEAVSHPEYHYFQLENQMKYIEGKLWGTVMGAFGACYALRNKQFTPLPGNFLVDDFYLTLHVLAQGHQVIFEPEATCYTTHIPSAAEEFRRKIRISAGNFQNLGRFKRFLLIPFLPVGFSFLSHKVLRWWGPFFLLVAWVSSLVLAPWNHFYLILFIIQSSLFFVPLLDSGLKRLGLQNKMIWFVSHFYLMNAALLFGFFKYLKGIRTNVWEPTKR